eukprot:gene13456-4331_t
MLFCREFNAANIDTIDPDELGKMVNLHELSIINCNIEEISKSAFDGAFENGLLNGALYLQNNKLKSFPRFSTHVPGLKSLHLDGNYITELSRGTLKNLSQLYILSMKSTSLQYIGDKTFSGENKLALFDASGSEDLEHISKNAFEGASALITLGLNNTKISEVPSIGLSNLAELHLNGVTSINSVSDEVINLPKLTKVYVDEQRRFLCCAFLHRRGETLRSTKIRTNRTRNCATNAPITTAATSTKRTDGGKSTTLRPTGSTTTDHFGGGFGRRRRALLWFGDWVPSNKTGTDPLKTSHPFFTDMNIGTHTVEERTAFFECFNQTNSTYTESQRLEQVTCYPEPDALRPCVDIMGNSFLTALSFIVSFIAVISNSAVFSILIMSRRQFTVTKYLIINLAFADLCLSLYLFILTCASIDTTGKYYNSVFSWQYEGGCDIVGFLAVFSSELSMLILTVITIERYLAIVYAVYLQKRLSFRQATILTSASWFIAVLIALLPLAGINSYREVAICLPFNIANTSDIAYLAFVFGFNTLLFIVIVGCYLKIYWEVAGPRSSGRPPNQGNDSSVAKRIALLVFTDFACWLPIAIVGMIAAAGQSASINMTVEKSKYLLVIFFPINSLCNPFLYALSTRTFRREFLNVLVQCGFCQDRLHKYHTNTFTGHSIKGKLDLKGRRATETINLSTLTSVNGSSTVKVGTPVLNSTMKDAPASNCESQREKTYSPSQDLLIVPTTASSTPDNNNGSTESQSYTGTDSNNKNAQKSDSVFTENLLEKPDNHRRTESTIQLANTAEEFDSAIETDIAF